MNRKFNFTIFNIEKDHQHYLNAGSLYYDMLDDLYSSKLSPINKPTKNCNMNFTVQDLQTLFGIVTHSCFRFKNNSRQINNLLSSSGIIIDFDNGETIESFEEKICKLDINYILYTSKSHRLNGNGDRFHVYFPFENDFVIDEQHTSIWFNNRIKEFINYLNVTFNMSVDFQVSDCARLIFQSQSSTNKAYQFKPVLNRQFCDFVKGCYFLPIESRKSKLDRVMRSKKGDKTVLVIQPKKYKEKTKREKKLSLYLNPLKPSMSKTTAKKFFKENLKNFIIDDRFIKNRDEQFFETLNNKYLMILCKSILFCLKENRYITRNSRTVPVRYLKTVIGLQCKLKENRIDELIKDFNMGYFVESHNHLDITLMPNKKFNFDCSVSFNEVITNEDVKRLLNPIDENDKKQKTKKNTDKFSISTFGQILCILYSSKHNIINKPDCKDNEIGYNQQKIIARDIGLSKQYVSKVLSDYDKMYYAIPLAYYSSDEYDQAKYFMDSYIEERKDYNIRIVQLDQYKDNKYMVYKTIGSRCILNKDSYRIKNYKIVDGKYDGKSSIRQVKGQSKTSKQDIIKSEFVYEFYNKGYQIDYKTEFKKGLYTYHSGSPVEMFVYISKKVYKTDNIIYCSLGKLKTAKSEEGLKKPNIISKENHDRRESLPDKLSKKNNYIKTIDTDRFHYDKVTRSQFENDYDELLEYERKEARRIYGSAIDQFAEEEERLEKEFYDEVEVDEYSDYEVVNGKITGLEKKPSKPVKPFDYDNCDTTWFENI